MNHQQFIDAMQQSADNPPTAVFIETPDKVCRWQAIFIDPGEARLEILVGPARRHVKSLKQVMPQTAIDKLIEFGYEKERGLPRNLVKMASGTPALISAGAWGSVEALFRYIFGIPLDRLTVRTEKMDWDWD